MGVNIEFTLCINQYRGANNVGTIIVISKPIHVQRGPWDYAYMTTAYVKTQDLHVLLEW